MIVKNIHPFDMFELMNTPEVTAMLIRVLPAFGSEHEMQFSQINGVLYNTTVDAPLLKPASEYQIY
jgi:hypothetical protein